MTSTQPIPSLQLGKYRLIIELAQGGMGNVYLAVASGPAGFSKLSVIKELKPSLLEEHGFLEMFLDEARLSARLSHQNVVQTNEASVEGGRAFLAMEYLEGQSLVRVRSRLGKRQKLPLGVHLRVVAEACRGLEYAHTLRDFDGVTPLGVVHRDVSPHNIFVTYDGQVKIVDFGVAKALSSNHETTVGVMKGKVPYMAPEQVMGAEMDRRVDVFALGVILWEAVANRRIWDQMRTETIIARLMSNDIPRLATVVPNAPPRLALVDCATAPSPDARFPTAEALRLEIEAYLHESGDGAHQTLRELGAAMAEGFAYERAQVAAAVTEQLRLLRQSPDATNGVGIVRLPAPQATASNPSGQISGQSAGLHISGPYPQVWHPGMSEPPPGGDQSGSGSGSTSQRYGRPAEASTSMAHAGAPRMPSAPVVPRGRPLALIAIALLITSSALAAVVIVGTRGKAALTSGTDASGVGDPVAVGAPPETQESLPATAVPAGAGSTAAESDAALAASGAPITSGRTRPTTPTGGGRFVPTARTTATTVVTAEPTTTAVPKTTKPDLGY